MAAAITDKFKKVKGFFSTTLSAQKTSGASTMSLSDATGVPTATGLVFTVGRVDSNGDVSPSTRAVYKGTLSGTTVSNLTLTEGTDQTHAAGTVVEITWTETHWNDAVDGILVHSNQDGTLKNNSVDTSQIASSAVETDKINDSAVTTAKIADSAITPAKWTNPYKFFAYDNTGTTATSSVALITMNTEVFDTSNNFDNATNYRFTAPIDGFYWFNARWESGGGTANSPIVYLYKNNEQAIRGVRFPGVTGNTVAGVVTGILQLSATDYVDARVSTASNTAGATGQASTFFQGFLISAT